MSNIKNTYNREASVRISILREVAGHLKILIPVQNLPSNEGAESD
jgi:hypothetical protein